jgi:hypothetical protein
VLVLFLDVLGDPVARVEMRETELGLQQSVEVVVLVFLRVVVAEVDSDRSEELEDDLVPDALEPVALGKGLPEESVLDAQAELGAVRGEVLFQEGLQEVIHVPVVDVLQSCQRRLRVEERLKSDQLDLLQELLFGLEELKDVFHRCLRRLVLLRLEKREASGVLVEQEELQFLSHCVDEDLLEVYVKVKSFKELAKVTNKSKPHLKLLFSPINC